MEVSERHNSTAERLQPAKATVSSRVESREQTEQTLAVVVYIGRPETEMKPANEAFDDLPPSRERTSSGRALFGSRTQSPRIGILPRAPPVGRIWKAVVSLGEVTSRNAVMG